MDFQTIKQVNRVIKEHFNKQLIITTQDEKFIIIHKFIGYVMKN